MFYSISISFILQVYIHNEALIQSTRHNIVDGFLEMTDRFEDPVNINSMLITVKDEHTCMTKESESIFKPQPVSGLTKVCIISCLPVLCYDLFVALFFF